MSVSVSAQDVNKLRQMTGVGMMDCKKALVEANGDFEVAVDLLRKQGQKVSANRAGRDAAEGIVTLNFTADNKTGVALALNCETDFVAKNTDFMEAADKFTKLAVEKLPSNKEELLTLSIDGRSLTDMITDLTGKIGEKIEISKYEKVTGEQVVGYVHSNKKIAVLVSLNKAGENVGNTGKDIAMQIAAMNPIAIDETSISQETIDREKSIVIEQIKLDPKMAGKPEEMIEKIAAGKLGSFFKENTLMAQAFVKDNSKNIKQVLEDTEKGLTVSEFKRIEIGK